MTTVLDVVATVMMTLIGVGIYLVGTKDAEDMSGAFVSSTIIVGFIIWRIWS